MRLALAQIDATVGDLAGNEAAIREGIARAKAAGAQIVSPTVTPSTSMIAGRSPARKYRISSKTP